MSAIVLFFLHVGFIIGALLLSLVVGTLVFYFRKEEPSFVGCGTRFIGHASGDKNSGGPVFTKRADFELHDVTQMIGTVDKEFDDIKIVFPLRQTDWVSDHILIKRPAS
ncbi:hypothetical protein N9102_00270 [bacterium]|nr:hypothetical protein [bacterium]MDB4561600.1 hypothetical protein [bacterium]